MREMLDAAIVKGFNSVGFSSHTSVFASGKRDIAAYRNEIKLLREEYEGRIKVYAGLEVDIYQLCDTSELDYTIGSVHFVRPDGRLHGVDSSMEKAENTINEYYGGDGLKYARDYYAAMCTLADFGSFDIIGHFDLVTKYSERKTLFDENSPDYRRYALEAVDALAGKIPLFEVNTGAIGRGYRTSPYPAPFILDALNEKGFNAVITTDCHNREYLDTGIDDARALLKAHGFDEVYALTESGFKGEKII